MAATGWPTLLSLSHSQSLYSVLPCNQTTRNSEPLFPLTLAILSTDTIDLQAHTRDPPSAQRHHRPTPDGSLAPHQAETLRDVAAEAAEENLRSPPGPGSRNGASTEFTYSEADTLIADDTNSMQAGTRQDALAIAQNGGLSGQEVEDGDMEGETEVDIDDDMMDKISSSPSIEDGGSISALPCFSLSSSDDFSHAGLLRSSSASPTLSDARSSSLYLDYPEFVPVSTDGEKVSFSGRHHHLKGEFELYGNSERPDPVEPYDDDPAASRSLGPKNHAHLEHDGTRRSMRTFQNMNNRSPIAVRSNRGPSWVPVSYRTDTHEVRTEKRPVSRPQEHGTNNVQEGHDGYDEQEMTVPYETDEDDDGDLPDDVDPRFVDSGWGGECLQESEDIDFEFVYALHTFVATVEGQANATKGDTMVLLDDSNSYWWLVRVVKDSSIGRYTLNHFLS